MNSIKKYWYLILPVFGFTAAYLILFEKSVDLNFKPLSSPEGFRELVLNSNSSFRIDPLFGLERAAQSVAPVGDKPNYCEALFRDPTSPSIGKDNANVSIVEFFDYRCPYCKKLTKILNTLVAADKDVRIIYKEWPILDKSSALSARAALAAARQGKYAEFHEKLMASVFIPTVGYVEKLATDFGLDLSTLSKDMRSSEITAALQRNASLAANLGFRGTPVLVVGRTIVQGEITHAQLETLVGIERSMALPQRC